MKSLLPHRALKISSWILLLLLSSCAVGYRVKDVEKVLDRNEKALGKMERGIVSDIKNKSKLLECFNGGESGKAAKDGEEISKKIQKLEDSQADISKLSDALEKRMKSIRQAVKGKKMITSKDPEFGDFKKSVASLEDDSSALQKEINQYSKISASFYSEAKKRKILLLDFNTLEGDLKKSSSSAQKSFRSAEAEMAKLKSLLVKKSPDNKESKLATLDEMTVLMKSIKEELNLANQTVADLSKQYPKKGLVCLAPHQPNYAYINDLNTHTAKVTNLGKDLEKLSKRFNSKK